MDKNFNSLSNDQLCQINGGLLGGAIAGAILGGAYGVATAAVGGVIYGNISKDELWKGYTAGAGIGSCTPL